VVEDLPGRHHVRAGGELQHERQTVEACADPSHRRGVLRGECGPGPDGARVFHEEGYGVNPGQLFWREPSLGYRERRYR
jgi:hypothetical protein